MCIQHPLLLKQCLQNLKDVHSFDHRSQTRLGFWYGRGTHKCGTVHGEREVHFLLHRRDNRRRRRLYRSRRRGVVVLLVGQGVGKGLVDGGGHVRIRRVCDQRGNVAQRGYERKRHDNERVCNIITSKRSPSFNVVFLVGKNIRKCFLDGCAKEIRMRPTCLTSPTTTRNLRSCPGHIQLTFQPTCQHPLC